MNYAQCWYTKQECIFLLKIIELHYYMFSFKYILLLPILFLSSLMNDYVYGQKEKQPPRYNELISIVSNYTYSNSLTTEIKTIPELLDKQVKGFIFHLHLKQDSSGINIITPNNQEVDFTLILETINNYCNKEKTAVISLFFKYDFTTEKLVDFFSKQSCYQKIWQGKPTNEWPTIESLISKKKQIICFGFKENSIETPLIKYLWKHAANPFNTLDINPKVNGIFCKGELKNELLFFTSFQFPKNTEGLHIPFQNTDFNLNPYFIEHNRNLWKNTGKKPNFLVFSHLEEYAFSVKHHLSSQLTINGTVSYNRKPLNKVYWEGDSHSITYGKFCFPATFSEDILLSPRLPGFRFVPDKIQIKNISENLIQNFIAVPVDIQEKMVAYLPFTNKVQDESPGKIRVKNSNVKIVFDSKRNEVGEFDGNSFIELPNANKLGISDNDFTVSAWIKISRKNDDHKRDFTVLGTEENYYRGGLHLQTRKSKPYFGFYSNDLCGNTELDANRWYHIVWRYSKFNQEQAIFVNGSPDGSSLNHPAFISNSNLHIGKSINEDNYFEGRIDDIVIWNRALGEEEIWNLYQDVFYLNENQLLNYFRRNKLFWAIGICLIIVLLAIGIYKKRPKQKRKYKANFKQVETNNVIPNSNTIKLFGEFQVIDKTGQDITGRFTPTLKQIFLLLIIHSKEKSNGITSDEFRHVMWPSFIRKKAVNNRGVSISKLRHLLDLMEGVKICNHQERWKITITDNVYCDYYDCLNYLNSDLFSKRDQLYSFLDTIKRGVYLNDSTYPWLDDNKGKVTNNVIDILTRLLDEFDLNQYPELVNQISDRILIADDLNEDALRYKIKVLLVLSQTNQAKFFYKSFKARYFELHKREYTQSFENLIH